LGVSLGETGNYAAAIDAIDEALLKRADPGFLYGRGRVNLLADNPDAALADFEGAAARGNTDAAKALKRLRQTP
jgi:tetratricopeptide (TPR) repeat protein